LMFRNLSDKVGTSNVLSFRGVQIHTAYLKLPNSVKARKVVKNRNNNFKWDEAVSIMPHSEARIFVDNGSVKRHELFGRIDSYGDLTENTYLLQFNSQTEVDEFFAKPLLEGCPWTDLNDAPYVKPTRKSSGVKSVYSEGYLFQASNGWRNSDHWKPCQIDIANGGGVYVEISHYTPVLNSISISAIESLSVRLKKCGIDLTIYGVRAKTAQTLGAGWKSYQTYTKELFDELTAKHGMESNWDYVTASIDVTIRCFATSTFDDYEFPSSIQSVVDTIKYVHSLKWNDEMYVAQNLFEGYSNSYESKLKPKIQQIFETYPMLRYVGYINHESDINRVKDYINLVG
jgi:hypothetical protein